MFPVSAVCLNGCEHDNKPVIPTFGNLVLTENTEEIFRTRCLTPIRQQNVDSFGLFFYTTKLSISKQMGNRLLSCLKKGNAIEMSLKKYQKPSL